MSATKLFSEILDDFTKATTKKERIEILQKYDHPMFRSFLILSFNKNIEFDVEIPQYRPAPEPAGLNFTYLDMEMDKIYRFIKNHPKRSPNLSSKKQKSLLVVILESLHKDEADLMVKMFKKNLDVKFLTPTIIKEAYPGINV
jgi:hypothetical protein